jgi:hypothetical protein
MAATLVVLELLVILILKALRLQVKVLVLVKLLACQNYCSQAKNKNRKK